MSDPDELSTKLQSWLEDQGYPLEMRVGRAGIAAGFSVVQSEFYSDPETNDIREIDIYAYKDQLLEKSRFRLSLVIECKSSKKRPWILFTSDHYRLGPASRVVRRAASYMGKAVLEELANREEIIGARALSIPERTGYALVEGLVEGNKTTFAACQVASKAAAAKSELSSGGSLPVCEVVLPAIVFAGRLFECYLDVTGGAVLQEIDSGTLIWRHKIGDQRQWIIRIATEKKAGELFSEAQSLFDSMVASDVPRAVVARYLRNYMSLGPPDPDETD